MPTVRRSWRSSGRSLTTRQPTGCGRSRSATSTPRAPIRTATSGRTTTPELHLIPRAIDAALGRDTFQIFGDDYDTPDGTCLRDYIHVTDLADAHVRALASLRSGGPSARYNLGNGRPTSVKEVVDAVARVTGRPVPATIGPRRAGDPGVLFASSVRIKQDLGWAPRFEEIDTIVRTAWQWRQPRPAGYRSPQGVGR